MSRELVQAWLAARQPAPPEALAARLRQVVAAAPRAALEGEAMSEALGTLGLATLAGLEGRGPQGEGVALDLLAADAFVTYAFEAAAEEGADLGALARRLLTAVNA